MASGKAAHLYTGLSLMSSRARAGAYAEASPCPGGALREEGGEREYFLDSFTEALQIDQGREPTDLAAQRRLAVARKSRCGQEMDIPASYP